MTGLLPSLFGTDDATTVYECRHCGESMDPNETWCPTCGRGQVASYKIS